MNRVLEETIEEELRNKYKYALIMPDQQTIDTYNKMATEYDEETAEFWHIFPHTFFDRFRELARERGTTVLDVGSGPGRDGLMLKKAGLDVTCLDASAAMVALSAQRGLSSIVGDFNHLPFTDQSFAGVWSYTALLHVPKNEITTPLTEIHRVLADNGVFGLGMIEGDTEGYKESSGMQLPRWFSYYTRAELEALLTSHNFHVIYFEQFRPGSKNYLNFIAQKR